MRSRRLPFLLAPLALAGCRHASPPASRPAGSVPGASLAAAERFVDAFYSFDRARLAAELAAADSAAPRILYYQGWAEGGHYRVAQRQPCAAEPGHRVRCAVTVRDDLIPALGIAKLVTDTFRLTVTDGRVRHVTTSSDDPPVFEEAIEWVRRERASRFGAACAGFFAGGPTPGECARTVVQGFGEFAAQRQRPTSLAGRSTVYAPSGMVATSQPLASAAGLEVLRQGGNAVDAAVAAAAVLSVTEPHMTGIGGDMFAIVWLAREQRLVALNASGRAGSRMTREALEARGFKSGSQQGVLSVTVPGALAGWDMLVRTHGKRTLAQALAPAIAYARDGFPVSPIIAAQWAGEAEFLRRDPAAAATYLPGGRAPKAGEWFTNADYARTLQEIATQGIGTFYGGALGQRIVARLAQLDGFVTLDDLKKNAPTWVTPISVPFRGFRVWELPPNNQGIAALEMLRILEPYDLKAMGHNSAAYLHHLIEAKKLAYADLERFVGDADHLDMPAERMLSDAFIAERRSHIDPARARERVDPGPLRTQGETVYLATADAEGNMVSFINSVYDYFGSGIVVPGTGFALHNRGAGFTLTPGMPNTAAPGKRPFHTLIPGFVTRTVGGREQAYMSFGLMGGGVQAQGHVQFLLNHFVFGMDVQAAIDAARFRHYDGQRVALEPPVGDAARAALAAMGHVLIDQPPGVFGGAQAIVRLPKGWAAGSDPRKDGMAVGY